MPKLALQSSLDDLPKLKISDYQKQTRLRLATTATACNYGGYRKWFVCKCGRRASVLYFSHYWQCRHCVGLPYQTQIIQPSDRLNERINRIRQRLGWVRGIAHGMGNKPKGMHQKTYRRLVAEYELLTRIFIGEYHDKYNPR